MHLQLKARVFELYVLNMQQVKSQAECCKIADCEGCSYAPHSMALLCHAIALPCHCTGGLEEED